jgi:uncharacterized protein YaiI (UPF0178 family)
MRRGIGEESHLPHVYVDADACPVKKEVYRVAKRYRLGVTLVANTWMRIPDENWVTLKVVSSKFDAADRWIVDHLQPGDIVVTADILLAGGCVKAGARVIGPTGKVFTEDNVDQAIATRNLLSALRDAGEMVGGPPPLQKKDRSRFLHKLDEIIQALRRDPQQ